MQTPSFFHEAPCIDLADPLAGFLGATTDGRITYTYTDVVKLAGHSCPTVAGAFLMAHQALAHLYGEETPERGNIKIEMRDAIDESVAGVIGNVISMITGAAGPGGFRGIGPKFKRSGLLSYGASQTAEVRFTRLDTGQSIGVDYDASVVPANPKQSAAMQAIMSGAAGPEQVAEFGTMWQERVGIIMTSPELWPVLVTLSE